MGAATFTNCCFGARSPHFYAFDLLAVDGEDLREQPLRERKHRLRAIMPRIESRLLYVDDLEARGCALFRAACERNVEGIVAK
jgi:bifunctional non-homologous end joining protein LigD